MFPKNDYISRLTIFSLVIMYLFSGSIKQMISQGVFTPTSMSNFAGEKPEDTSRYTIRINSLNGETLSDPLYIDNFDTYALLPEGTRMGELKLLIAQLGNAYYEENLVEAEFLGAVLMTYMSEFQSADYDLVLRVFNPVEKYSLDEYVVDNIVASFTYRTKFKFN